MPENEDRVPIYVAGYPKSGTTWLTRLLAQALNSPSGASIPELDAGEPATEGWDRPGNYVVRKGHFLPHKGSGKTAVTKPHRIDVDAEFTAVCLVRDPRDVAVSMAAYKGWSLHAAITGMTHGGIFGLPAWAEYIALWLAVALERSSVVMTRYEDLLDNPVLNLRRIISSIGMEVDREAILQAVHDQEIGRKRRQVERRGDEMPGGKLLNQALLRKGTAGQWASLFDDEQQAYALETWGQWLAVFRYEEIYDGTG